MKFHDIHNITTTNALSSQELNHRGTCSTASEFIVDVGWSEFGKAISHYRQCRNSVKLIRDHDQLKSAFFKIHQLNIKLRLKERKISDSFNIVGRKRRDGYGGGGGSHNCPSPVIGIFNFLTFLVYAFSVLLTLFLLATGSLTGTFLANLINVIVNNNNNNNNDNNNMSNNNNNNDNMNG